MAQFELNIYGENDEIIKKFETDKVRWGIFTEALKVHDTIKEKKPAEQFGIISDFIKRIFPSLTDEELDCADFDDVMNTFLQLVNKAQKIGANAKNAAGAE